VSENPGKIPMEEIMRVLAPLGVAYVKQDGQWAKIVKPWPKEMDEWQQHFHDADNNAVARDRLVGPPRRYQWVAEPQWMRSHMSMPSISSLVSSKGRLFTVEDLGSAEHPALPGKFALVARDAFNGIVLWQRPFPDWHPVNIHTKLTPVQLQRRLVAIGELLYCTPGFTAPVTALEAATGKVIKTYDGTERTTEFLYDRGVLYAVIGDPTDTLGVAGGSALGTSQFSLEVYGPKIPVLADPKSMIVALDADTGRTLWQKSGGDTAGYQGGSLAVRGSYAVYSTAKDLVCLDQASGRQVWHVPTPIILKDRIGVGGVAASLVLSDNAAYRRLGKHPGLHAQGRHRDVEGQGHPEPPQAARCVSGGRGRVVRLLQRPRSAHRQDRQDAEPEDDRPHGARPVLPQPNHRPLLYQYQDGRKRFPGAGDARRVPEPLGAQHVRHRPSALQRTTLLRSARLFVLQLGYAQRHERPGSGARPGIVRPSARGQADATLGEGPRLRAARRSRRQTRNT
ncbi:MAG: PQQ-binding-like beta-propeller repeat protein, partial [Candidatus Brocadiae bacterium]|nr:PQQ-binding-like beta-propeller repeat protein [Candidatus Brocadiia bacterium]